VDDAHAAGVIDRGRGTVGLFALPRQRVVQTITLSKAFGAFGGAILCDEEIHHRISEESPLFIGSTPAPLPMVAAALEALQIISTDGPMHKRLSTNIDRVRTGLSPSRPVRDQSNPILAIYPGNQKQKERLRAALEAEGVYPSLIRYPGAAKAEFFRFSISSQHTRKQLDRLIMAIRSIGETTTNHTVFP
jgi:7-keto-8-aminopelargonate synthetase-like enzyme